MADQENSVNPSFAETGTRKTMVLKPLTAAKPIVPVSAADNTNTGNLGMVDDSQSRQTVKLTPLNPLATKNAPDDTDTRKAAVIRPAASGAPAPAAPAPGMGGMY